METIGIKLAALRAEKNVSLAKVARDGGWGGASSVQKYFEATYDQSIRPHTAERLAVSLGDEVLKMVGVESSGTRPSRITEIIQLLRDDTIPAGIRAAAAAEMLSRTIQKGSGG